MKRKIIQLAGKTLVVSLPVRLVKKFYLKKGQELEVHERQGNILIETSSIIRKPIYELDAKELHKSLNRILGALYKQGQDEIILTNVAATQLATIKKTLQRTCIGFEIVEQTRNRVRIKSVSSVNQDDFQSVLRRLFLTLINSMQMMIDMGLKPKNVDILAVQEQDNLINKYCDFCRRIINLRDEQENALYHVVEEVEKLGDLIKLIAPLSRNQQTMTLLKKGLLALDGFYDAYYRFDLSRIEDRMKLPLSIPSKKENNAANVYLHMLLHKVRDLYGALLVLKL